jgi:leucyl aminopeptidase
MASEHRLLYKEISQDEARDMGMGCFYSVAKGSENPGRVVILEHKPKSGTATKTIGLVGKGVCYDTGGISLKPSSYMHGMKYDMSGAAAVFATMRVIAALDLNVNVVAVTPLVENMPSGRASKQDDVVTALNGSTVEIDNTDAEGRLILSDALTYIQREYNPDLLIDIATLTGSCAAALGYYHSGLMTRDEELSASLLEVGSFVGDKLWRLPLTDEYKVGLESPVADIVNCAPAHYKAGATMAGIFLEHFVDKDRRWAHLDIAGTDSKVPNVSYIGRTATGVGARVLIEFIRRNAA